MHMRNWAMKKSKRQLLLMIKYSKTHLNFQLDLIFKWKQEQNQNERLLCYELLLQINQERGSQMKRKKSYLFFQHILMLHQSLLLQLDMKGFLIHQLNEVKTKKKDYKQGQYKLYQLKATNSKSGSISIKKQLFYLIDYFKENSQKDEKKKEQARLYFQRKSRKTQFQIFKIKNSI
ncbi:unnamed protein product [Paramecium sonneborni]|uniref:Uncharacterized protein n=1 Tax=Paramecium sonneborni TaxID=65129 RepID=A0A8S1RG53_9CILI|nr:unnamed protein product [Paramecium sonneborni]